MSKYLEIPTMWEELTADQFAYLLKLVHEAKPDEVTIGDILLKYADYLLGERKIVAIDRRAQYYKLVQDVAETLTWIFAEDEDGNYLLNFATTQNLLPEIYGFIGPQSHGRDLVFGEYRTAVDMMNRFTNEKNPFFLDALCGILYRKPLKKSKGLKIEAKMRSKYNKHHVSHYARGFEKVSEHIKWGVYLWFAYFNRYLIEGGEFIIEGNTLAFDSLFDHNTNEDNAEQMNIGLMSIVFTLADTGTFGNAEQTDDTLLFQILMKLLSDKQLADKLKKNDRN